MNIFAAFHRFHVNGSVEPRHEGVVKIFCQSFSNSSYLWVNQLDMKSDTKLDQENISFYIGERGDTEKIIIVEITRRALHRQVVLSRISINIFMLYLYMA